MNVTAANDPDHAISDAREAVSNAEHATDDDPAAEAMPAEQSQQNSGNLSSFFLGCNLNQLLASPNTAGTHSDGMAVDVCMNVTPPSDAEPLLDDSGKFSIFLSPF
jgi:hypothetical protein